MIINLLIDGGAMAPGPVIAQKIGPLGIDMGKVIADVNKATEMFKGTKVPVEINIDPATKKYTIKVSTPPVAGLLKKELKLEKASGDHKNIKVANMAIEQVIAVAKMKLSGMLEKDLKAAVKSVVGTCVSLGVLIENKTAKEVAKEVEAGVYDKEIKSEKTDVSPEKKKSLDKFFAEVKLQQERKQKKAEEEKAAAEQAKTAEASKAGAASTDESKGTAATPKAGAAAKPEAAKKPAAKSGKK